MSSTPRRVESNVVYLGLPCEQVELSSNGYLPRRLEVVRNERNIDDQMACTGQGLLERLEAENSRLRDRAIDLALQIQAMRDGLTQ